MPEPLRCVAPDSVITGWDFSTGSVKCLAFDLEGRTLAEVRLDTDLWKTKDREVELNLLQLEGQARASTRAIAARLRELGRLRHWAAGGLSATHHTAGRIDRDRLPVRRAICWNDQSLIAYHERGLARLGKQERARELTGGPWAVRYSLSHLVKDEEKLSESDWRRTWRMLPHGALAGGYLTGNFDVCSLSVAASTGIMDLRNGQWRREMLEALANPTYRHLAWEQLPRIVEQNEPLGPLANHVCLEAGVGDGVGRPAPSAAPLIFPTSDDQQAGLVGGGAVDDGQVAVILGNSAVVNSSSARLTGGDSKLDVMRLNWGPYLWMRCYGNGAQFLDPIVGERPDWDRLERLGRACPPGAGGVGVLPFANPEESLGLKEPLVRWFPSEPDEVGPRFRAALEAIAYLIRHGIEEHEQAGQRIRRVSVSGGITRSDLMCEILASVLDRPLSRLVSNEGCALGAAVTALAALENHLRRHSGITGTYTVADAVAQMVKFREVPVRPNPGWVEAYRRGYEEFRGRLP